MPSPTPIPTNLKVIRGTARPCRLNEKEPRPEKLKTIRPPVGLSKAEKKCWRTVVAELQKAGIITRVDVSALESYCRAWVGWIEESRKAEEEGSVVKGGLGGPIINPRVRIANEHFKKLLSLWREFGMTPSSRSRIRADTDKPDDDFDAWQKKRRMAHEGV